MKIEQRVIGVFLKNWLNLPVKTRLAEAIGSKLAIDLYCAMIKVLANTLKDYQGARVVWCGAGGREGLENILGNYFNFREQIGGDLGARMQAFAHSELSLGSTSVIIIGTDSLYLNVRDFDRAFEILEDHRLVFQPSTDGGYTLVGMNQITPEIFNSMPWSQNTLMNVTLQKIKQCNYTYQLLEERSDIDTIDDLLNWCSQNTNIIHSNQNLSEFSDLFVRLKKECR